MDKQERIDRAVIELDGVWPDMKQKGYLWWSTDGYRGDNNTGYSAYGEKGHATGQEFVCTYPEFMEARKRLENKPTEWPEGYIYKIQTANGYWWFSKKEPRHNHQGEVECEGLGNLMYSGNFGEPFNWSQSLEPRPHPDHKEGEGVEWEPGVDLPPIGTTQEDCELVGFAGDYPQWEVIARRQSCAILYVSDPDGDEGESFTALAAHFAPLKSHRDKVIEAAMKACGLRARDGAKECLGELFDVGMLKLPGDDQ